MLGLFKRGWDRFIRYQTVIIGGASLVLLLVSIIWAFYLLGKTSMEKSRINRSEIFDRDLKELVGQFDADERYVLENNLSFFITEKRQLSPLMLPRQYYVALPKGSSKFIPRPPPRNCFVNLQSSFQTTSSDKLPDKFCSYFAENKNVGTYLFIAMTFVDPEVVLLRPGDTKFVADSITVTIKNGGLENKWLLVFQAPPNVSINTRYQITAFRETHNQVLERDKRLEGWAYIQKQANNSNIVNLIARFDYKEFYDQNDEVWPPENWSKTRIFLTRTDASNNSEKVSFDYDADGESVLSIPSLSSTIFNAYATLKIRTPNGIFNVTPNASQSAKSRLSESYIQLVDGDLLLRHEPIIRSLLLQDTDLAFEIEHPGEVIEKPIWVTGTWLVIILFGFTALMGFLFLRVLKPIWVLSRQSRLLLKVSNIKSLPFSDRKDEIGALSNGFNELLRVTKDHALREQLEREERELDQRRKRETDLLNREIVLKIIGHEIRNPLQSLVNLHIPGTKSRRYIDRIFRAVTNLFGAYGPESAFAMRELYLEKIDLKEYLSELAKQSHLANIPSVLFEGPSRSVYVQIDQSVLEDAITNILKNANDYRKPGTPIFIKLRQEKNDAFIDISNDGPHIPPDQLSRIFDLYFSTKQQDKENEVHGIGLYAARNYIVAMGGSITASNEIWGVNFKLIFKVDSQSRT